MRTPPVNRTCTHRITASDADLFHECPGHFGNGAQIGDAVGSRTTTFHCVAARQVMHFSSGSCLRP
jgi:hypothetical protein